MKKVIITKDGPYITDSYFRIPDEPAKAKLFFENRPILDLPLGFYDLIKHGMVVPHSRQYGDKTRYDSKFNRVLIGPETKITFNEGTVYQNPHTEEWKFTNVFPHFDMPFTNIKIEKYVPQKNNVEHFGNIPNNKLILLLLFLFVLYTYSK